MSMNRRILIATTACAALLVASGCAESQRPKASGKGSVRGIHAVVTAPELIFRIEERSTGDLGYRNALGFNEWDDLSYNFSFDVFLPDEPDAVRIATQFIDVAADTEYSIVLTGTLDNPSILTWEDPQREWDGTETVFELDFFHASPELGQVDIYYAIEGTVPMVGTEIATLDSGEREPLREFPAGNYELIVTAPGDPSTILFQSPAFTHTGGRRLSIGFFDPGAAITASVGVNIYLPDGASQNFPDISSPPLVRTGHAAFGTGNFDGYLDNDFGIVVFPNVGLGEVSGYVDAPEVLTPLTFTAAGDPGTVLLEHTIQRINNSLRTIFLWGAPGDLKTRSLPQNARPVSTWPTVRLTSFATNIESLDIYEIDEGTVIDDLFFPNFLGLPPGETTSFFPAKSGIVEYVVTLRGDKTPIAPPLELDLAAGDIIDIIILDTADPTVVEMQIFDSSP